MENNTIEIPTVISGQHKLHDRKQIHETNNNII